MTSLALVQDFTPSKRALLRSCARWLLPGVTWVEVDRVEYATGNEFHDFIRRFLHREPEALQMADRVPGMLKHARMWLERRMALGARFDAEVKVAWNVVADTARFLTSKLPRDYSEKTFDEKAGTVDLIEFDGGRVTVWDWQTTHAGGDPPDKTDQLRTYALWVARVYEVDRIGIGTILVTEQGVYPSDVVWLDAIELDAECDALRAELSQSPEPKPGPHCKGRRCPAIGSCEAFQEEAAALVPVASLTRRSVTTEIEDREHARWLLLAVEIIEEKLGPIKKVLREWSDANGGIDDGSGRSWSGAPKSTETPQLDVPGAVDLVREAGAGEAIEMKVTWSAIERAVGAAKAEDIRAALRAAGATKVSTYSDYRWRKLKIGKPRAA